MHPYHHSPWVDIAAVVFVCALILAPLGYLAADLMGGGGSIGGTGGGVVASSPRPTAPRPHGFAARRARPAPEPLAGTRPSAPTSGSRYTPFSADWRERATPSLTTPGPGDGSSSETFGSPRHDVPSGIASSSGASEATDRGGAGASSDRPGWVGAAREFGSSALALSRQLETMDRDPVQRSLGPEAAPSEEADRASGSTSAATTNGNPPLPSEPVPVGDHLHWLLVTGLLWGVWRLQRG